MVRRIPGERLASEDVEDVAIAELGAGAPGQEGALDEATLGHERRDVGLDRLAAEAQTSCEGVELEGAVRPRVAGDEATERAADRRGERRGKRRRRSHAERIAQAGGILDGGEASLPGDGRLEEPSRVQQLGSPRVGLAG